MIFAMKKRSRDACGASGLDYTCSEARGKASRTRVEGEGSSGENTSRNIGIGIK